MSELAQSLAWPRDEAELVDELQAGSEAAFDSLVTHYHASVFNLVYGILGSRGRGRRDPGSFPARIPGIHGFHKRSSLKTWLYRISVRQALNQRRWFWRHHRQQFSIDAEPFDGATAFELPDDVATPFEQCAAHEVQATVRRALSAVPPIFRSAVILRDLEGLSDEETAEVLEVSVGSVKSRILRGRRLLKDILDPLLRAKQVSRPAPPMTAQAAEVPQRSLNIAPVRAANPAPAELSPASSLAAARNMIDDAIDSRQAGIFPGFRGVTR